MSPRSPSANWVDVLRIYFGTTVALKITLKTQGPDILLFQVAFVERQICTIKSHNIYYVNKVLKWSFSKSLREWNEGA